MSRINTNISSLIAQTTLARSNSDLQTALNRLSTGLRINQGKDDPAGLIASENLRRDITGVEKAISNSERANQLIATADSGLGQVSSLLNDIRGLVSEAANSGALSSEQIAANQLQVDSSLEAIDRIAQVTTFQGRRLLDGSLDFLVNGVSNFDRVSNVQIDQANFGSANSIAVSVDVTTAATQAQVDITNIPATTSAVNAFGDTALSNVIAQATGSYTTTNTSHGFSVTADAAGPYDGAAGNTYSVTLVDDAVNTDAAVVGNTIRVRANLGGGAVDVGAIQGLINGVAGFSSAVTADPAGFLSALDAGVYANLTGGRDAGSATIRATADTAGTAANGVTVTLAESTTITNNTASASINATTGNIDVAVRGTVSYSAIAAAIDGLSGYSAGLTASSGDQNYIDTSDSPPGAPTTLGGGVDAAGGLAQSVVFELGGATGTEVFSFDAGASITQLETAIDSLSDSTGISATVSGTTLQLISSAYGDEAFVDISVTSEAAGGTITAAIGQGSRSTGADAIGTINGIKATGDGNSLAINTSTLDLSLSVDVGFTGNSSFSITGGGALFQLGPDVVSNQQARLGIASVNTASLGGDSGRLFELRTGEAKSLANSPTSAAEVVDEVITKVSELRGRLGAFQRTTLESNIASLSQTLTNLTDAESSIRDADFAVESARLTRAQILVQSGTSVLAIANQNPQNVLALLR